MSFSTFKNNATNKLFVYKSYRLIYMYQEDLALNNLHKTQPTDKQNTIRYTMYSRFSVKQIVKSKYKEKKDRFFWQ